MVKFLGIATLADGERGIDEDFGKRNAFFLGAPRRRRAIGAKWGNQRHDHDRADISEMQRELRCPADILVAVFQRNPEILAEPRAKLVAIHHGREHARCTQSRFEASRERRLPRGGEAGEKQDGWTVCGFTQAVESKLGRRLRVLLKAAENEVFQLNLTSLLNMTSFKLYPLDSRCKHSRCHDGSFVKVLQEERGWLSRRTLSGPLNEMLTSHPASFFTQFIFSK